MPQTIAFLRAINVGGRTVTMDALRDAFAQLGLTGAETFIASGNVILPAKHGAGPELERRIEAGLAKALGYEVATFLRTVEEVAAIAAHRPFPEQRLASAQALNVGFLKEPLAAPAGEKLAALATHIDSFHLHGRELYWLCELKQSESKLSNTVFERALGVRTTFRGINTVRRLAAKYPPD